MRTIMPHDILHGRIGVAHSDHFQRVVAIDLESCHEDLNIHYVFYADLKWL
jgi:hypothetical protein